MFNSEMRVGPEPGFNPDLSAGLVNVLTDIIWKSTIDWHAGNVGCKMVRYGQGVVTYGSTYALVALSLDRLHAIARPLGFTRAVSNPHIVAWDDKPQLTNQAQVMVMVH
nr:hypothetical protein BaRGS_009238 [Batillaria attramentaria]